MFLHFRSPFLILQIERPSRIEEPLSWPGGTLRRLVPAQFSFARGNHTPAATIGPEFPLPS